MPLLGFWGWFNVCGGLFYRRAGGRIGGGFGDFVEGVAVGVMEGLCPVRNDEYGVLFVAPATVGMVGDGDGIALGFEGVFEEGVGKDAVFKAAAPGTQGEGGSVGSGIADSHRGLPARNGKGENDVASGGFPQPITDLVVEGFDAARLEDMGVIAQAVVELRAVGLGISS